MYQRPGWSPPPHGQGPGGFLGPGGKTTYGTAPVEDTGQEVDIHLGNDGTGRGRVLENGGIHQADPEHSRIVHCFASTVRLV